MKDRVSKRFDPSTDRVALLTLHSSKGFEFQVVAIGGLGFIPYRESEAEDDARLLYVGMTRATDELFDGEPRQCLCRKIADVGGGSVIRPKTGQKAHIAPCPSPAGGHRSTEAEPPPSYTTMSKHTISKAAVASSTGDEACQPHPFL